MKIVENTLEWDGVIPPVDPQEEPLGERVTGKVILEAEPEDEAVASGYYTWRNLPDELDCLRSCNPDDRHVDIEDWEIDRDGNRLTATVGFYRIML